ncbi:hypothetical protein [Chryseobacterium sp. SNU WT5]|uniref:hypothetical protein n=1 Tax=Chryseobacterium sp. SNU WT5 TaxID=2594269 RepID=UPI001E56CDBD|nr:hypothetical protein [Chryseobacterium sp. SNU WT5]
MFLALASIAITSCRKEDEGEVIPEVSIETQNSYDDQAATKFLETHYFDSKGNIKQLDAADVTNVKLSALNPVKLPSGVIYVMRANAQPNPGNAIGNTDIIRLMSYTNTYIAKEIDSKVSFTSPFLFSNNLAGLGVPDKDPIFYYVNNAKLNSGTSEVEKKRNYYEIEGFKEALQKFKAYDIPNESDYNLQGVIIVPSRAAFARDPHFNYSNVSLANRSFVFNFQIYKAETRPTSQE